jgi:hypothetical protein
LKIPKFPTLQCSFFATRRSSFSFIVCGGYGGFEPDADCRFGSRQFDRVSVGSRESEALVVNNLLFADDTLIFCGAQEEQIRHLRCIFLCFEVGSGLRINLGKSEVVPIGG